MIHYDNPDRLQQHQQLQQDSDADDSSTLRMLGSQADFQEESQEPSGLPEAQEAETAFRTSLKLTPERQEWLRDRCIRRINEVKKEMGLDLDGSVIPGSWMDIRRRNQDSYDNDYSWRVGLGGIFRKSNFSLGQNKRHVREISAKVQDDLLGTSPFFGVMGRNPDRAELARQTEEYVQGEVDRAPVRRGLREAQKIALIRNEAVVKPAYVKEESNYIGPARVLAGTDGLPIKTPDKGLFVLENDNFLPHPRVQGLQLLEKDPSFATNTISPVNTVFVMNADGTQTAATYEDFDDLPQTVTHFEGPRAEALDYRCFLCPLRVASVHEADINVHLFRRSPYVMAEEYAGIDVSEDYRSWWNTVGSKKPVRVQGEQEDTTSVILQECTYGETYIRCDADDNGREEQLFVVMDLDNQKMVFYDYLANVFKATKRRPFESIPGLEKYPGRWYGYGVFTTLEDHELHTDAEFNRAQVKGSRSSSLTFRYRDSTEEWQAGLPVVFGDESVLNVNPAYDAINRPPIFKVNLAEDNEKAIELMEITRQASDSMIGSVSAADASQSNMNQSKTATGIINLQQSGDLITKATEQEQAEAIGAILEQIVEMTLWAMDKTTLLLNKDASQLILLNRDEIRALDRDVRLILTRSRSTQLFNTSQQAIDIGLKYRQLMLQDPEGARMNRASFIDSLRALEVTDADEKIPEITDEMIAQHQQAQGQKNATISERVMLNYKDAPGPIQRQVEAAYGLQPLTPQEEAQEATKEVTLDKAKQATRQPPQQPPGRQRAA